MSTEETLILHEIQNIKNDLTSLRDEFNEKLGQTNEQVNKLLVRVEQSLARQEEVCRNGISQRTEHHRTLYGQGLNEPGLVAIVQDNSSALKEIKAAKESNRLWILGLAASVIMLFLGKVFDLISYVFSHMPVQPPPQ